MFRLQKKYLLITVILFLIEVGIALFVRDRIIRPYMGDLLVVILIYCFIRSFFNIPIVILSTGVLLFAYIIELSQYLNLIKHFGLQNSKLAILLFGNSFQWLDMIAYTLGISIVIFIEKSTLPTSSNWTK